mmetsp:Transcript_25797/g.56104  ORF Transcript_25797/g.56104 Transcript_25797/m.56104 type:complete len:206 (+) Transcript_25797:789-1406(+)
MADVCVVEWQNEGMGTPRLLHKVILPWCGPHRSMQLRGHSYTTFHLWRSTLRIRSEFLLHFSRKRNLWVPEVGDNEGGPVLARHYSFTRLLPVSKHETARGILLHYGRLVKRFALVSPICLQEELMAAFGCHVLFQGWLIPAQLFSSRQDLCVPAWPFIESARRSLYEVASIAAIAERSTDLPGCTEWVLYAGSTALLWRFVDRL